jgi:DNA-binding MurR/RpiR family transcriptional regulator
MEQSGFSGMVNDFMDESCFIPINRMYASMSGVEKKIADILMKSPEKVIHMTIAELASELAVSEGSIIRFCQTIGLGGYAQLKINLARNISSNHHYFTHFISEKSSPREIVAAVMQYTEQAIRKTAEILEDQSIDQTVNAMLRAGRIEFYGIGTSAIIADDAYYRLMRIGMPAYSATDPHIMRASAEFMNQDCVAVGISHTGRTIETIRALEIAKSKGAVTVCITGFLKSPIVKTSDISLLVSSYENEYLQEAVTSRTAQIALLDGICAVIAMKKKISESKRMDELTSLLNENRL